MNTVRDGITRQPLGMVEPTPLERVDEEVRLASEAQPQWAADGGKRSSALPRWADALDAAAEEMADVIVGEVGKIRAEALREVRLSADALRYNAGITRQLEGQAGRLAGGSIAFVERIPVGVTSFIVPWNTPVLLLFRDLAPALAAGVTAVVKPSPEAPLSVVLALEPGRGAGVPQQVVRIVQGDVHVGKRMITHPLVRAVAFTGSVAVGRSVMTAAAQDFTRVLLELGGRGASVILSGADLDVAVRESVAGACFTTGQMCMAVTRILAERAIYADVLGAVVERVAEPRTGGPRDDQADLGPLLTHAHRDQVLDYVELARREPSLVVGGKPSDELGASFPTPAVVTDVPPASRIVQEEIFGPVITVEPFDGDAEAVTLANASPFGLSMSVWTGKLDRAWHVARGIEAGTVWVNRFGGLFAEVPFGGMRASGRGRTRGREGLHAFSEIRTINWNGAGQEPGQ